MIAYVFFYEGSYHYPRPCHRLSNAVGDYRYPLDIADSGIYILRSILTRYQL